MDGWVDVSGRMRCMAECSYGNLSIYLKYIYIYIKKNNF